MTTLVFTVDSSSLIASIKIGYKVPFGITKIRYDERVSGSIDWGDGNTETFTGPRVLLHTYSEAGTYTATFTGTIGSLVTKTENLTDYTIDLGDFVTVTDTGPIMAFPNCQLTSIYSDISYSATSYGTWMFRGNQLTEMDSTGVFNHVEFAPYMFADNNLTAIPSVYTFPYLTDGGGMFMNNQITAIDDSMIFARLTNGTLMFANNALTDVGDLTMLQLEIGDRMFMNNDLTELPSTLRMPELVYGDRMFYGCPLTSIGTAEWTNLVSAEHMFAAEYSYDPSSDTEPTQGGLTDLPGDLDLSSLVTGTAMFCNQALTRLTVDLSALVYGNGMFSNCNIATLDVDGLDLLRFGTAMFSNNELTTLGDITLPILQLGAFMFVSNNLTKLPDDMTLTVLTDGRSMFMGNQLTTLPDGLNLKNLQNGHSMFRDNASLTTVPDGLFENTVCTNMSNMFFGTALTADSISSILTTLAGIGNTDGTLGLPYGFYDTISDDTDAITAYNTLIANGWTITGSK